MVMANAVSVLKVTELGGVMWNERHRYFVASVRSEPYI